MLRKLENPKKIFFFPRKDWEVPGDQGGSIASLKSGRLCTVYGRLQKLASLNVLKKGGNLNLKSGC